MKEFMIKTAGRLAFLALFLVAWPSLVFAQESAVLDDSCIVSILNRNTQISPNGDFVLSNIPIPVGAKQRAPPPDAPDAPDRTGLDDLQQDLFVS